RARPGDPGLHPQLHGADGSEARGPLPDRPLAVSVRTEVTVEGVADILEPALAGPYRRAFVDEALAPGSVPRALDRLRSAMRVHRFRAGGTVLDLVDGVERLDRRTRSEGFRVLHAWNYRTHEFSRENTPVMLLDYFRDIGMVEGTERSSL